MRKLSSGIAILKDGLLQEFRDLYSLKGRKWPQLLRDCNSWHGTLQGNIAWRNAIGGNVGNESLRIIITDMKQILAEQPKELVREHYDTSATNALHALKGKRSKARENN